MSKMPTETVGLQISHEQVWLALQLIATNRLFPYVPTLLWQIAEFEDQAVIYLPETSTKAVEEIAKAVIRFSSVVIYSWEPGIIRRRLDHPGVTVTKIPSSTAAEVMNIGTTQTPPKMNPILSKKFTFLVSASKSSRTKATSFQ